jgi:DNA-binding transcriptional ArsR family regulator
MTEAETPDRSAQRRAVSANLRCVPTYQVDAWAALGDPTRRVILGYLAERPRPVGELARELPVSRPAVSQHLKVLKEAGLVTDESAGTRRIYRVNPEGLAELRTQLDRFWSQALANFKLLAEQATDEEEK